jgi:hypothetical protein
VQVLPDGDLPGQAADPFGFDVIPASIDIFPGLVDSNSPAYWRGDTLNLLNSAWGTTFRSQGSGALALQQPTPVKLPVPMREGTVWIEAVWQDVETHVLYGWYHFEPSDSECEGLTAPSIGAAISRDGGATWEDQGFVLENGYPNDCNFVNGFFTGGNGDFSVILGPNGTNLYFLFSNYQGPQEEQGVAIARSALADRGQPGTVYKYYRGRWDEPGIGGRASALFKTPTGWAGPDVDAPWGPSVHWNYYLNSYVVLFNRVLGQVWEQGGIYMSFSRDLLNWTEPILILETNEYYPQVLGLGDNGTDTLGGQVVRVYVGGISEHIIEFNLEGTRSDGEVARHDARREPVPVTAPAAALDGEAPGAGEALFSPEAEAPAEEPLVEAEVAVEPPSALAAPDGDEGAPVAVDEDVPDTEAGPDESVPDL